MNKTSPGGGAGSPPRPTAYLLQLLQLLLLLIIIRAIVILIIMVILVILQITTIKQKSERGAKKYLQVWHFLAVQATLERNNFWARQSTNVVEIVLFD